MIILTIAAVFFLLICGLAILGGTPWGKKIEANAAKIRSRMEQRKHSVPDRYPFVLDTSLLTVTDERLPARLELYADHLSILGGRPASVLAYLSMTAITHLMFQDRTTEGLPMAGIWIGAGEVEYRFFSDGFLAPTKLQQTLWTIQAVKARFDGEWLDIVDYSLGRATVANIKHRGPNAAVANYVAQEGDELE